MSTQKRKRTKQARPPQRQARQPGLQSPMRPQPVIDDPQYRAAGKLAGKVALITGGDSGIGAAVAIAFAKEGASVAVAYLNEHRDARNVKQTVEDYGQDCELFAGDIGDERRAHRIVKATLARFGRLDIIVNNAAEQHEQDSVSRISRRQLERTFRTNIFSQFFVLSAAIEHLRKGSSIINTTSVTAYRGSPHLIDYASTKGAIVAMTRSLASALVTKGIRVNAVAPGPVWTPLIPASFDAKKVAQFGSDSPMGRAAEPAEIAPCFVFLASNDSSFMSGQVLHPNGGEVVGG